jgi:hypothetical protein
MGTDFPGNGTTNAMISLPLDLPEIPVLKIDLTTAGHRIIPVESILEGMPCLS